MLCCIALHLLYCNAFCWTALLYVLALLHCFLSTVLFPLEFDGNVDDDTVKTNIFTNHIKARYVRIQPTAWVNHITLRAELYGCSLQWNTGTGLARYSRIQPIPRINHIAICTELYWCSFQWRKDWHWTGTIRICQNPTDCMDQHIAFRAELFGCGLQ